MDAASSHPSVRPSETEARAFWHGLINYEQRTPAAADLKLDRIRTLLGRLGRPQDRLRIIHVAGTKGKGSTAAMLATILRRAGYRTGLFTSPHLCRVEERFQVDGAPISAAELTALLHEVRAAVEGGRRLPITFFEAATAVGFLHFVRRRVDAAVVEVGLGGRFDSTNVCRPVIAVIASISLDHTQQLGDRVAAIAMEKAGIVKPGRPTLSGAAAPEARPVIERICRERRSPLRQLGVDFTYDYEPGRVAPSPPPFPPPAGGGGLGRQVQRPGVGFPPPAGGGGLGWGGGQGGDRPPRVRVTTRGRVWPWTQLSLLGEHQAANAALAVACVEQLRREGWTIPDAAVFAGLAATEWPARMEVVGRPPLVVLDCAHNVASAEALVQTLQESFPPGRRLLVFAASSDKDIAGMFRILAPHFAHAFLTPYLGSTRSTPPERLAELLRAAGGPPATAHPAPAAAWEAARAAAGPDDLICVAGSVFLAGELRPLLTAAAGKRER